MYDYAMAGAYFVTVCTHDREPLFGNIVAGDMRLNALGQLVEKCWYDLPAHYHRLQLDAFTVMPNHVHGIIVLNGHLVGAGFKPAPTQEGFNPVPQGMSSHKRHGVPEIVRAFKTFSARGINRLRNTSGTPVWQRNYYEHVIRDEDALDRIREYIVTNSRRWRLDKENPDHKGADEFDRWLSAEGRTPIPSKGWFQTRPAAEGQSKIKSEEV
jgi:REP element-mobilizing transposase RayT